MNLMADRYVLGGRVSKRARFASVLPTLLATERRNMSDINLNPVMEPKLWA